MSDFDAVVPSSNLVRTKSFLKEGNSLGNISSFISSSGAGPGLHWI